MDRVLAGIAAIVIASGVYTFLNAKAQEPEIRTRVVRVEVPMPQPENQAPARVEGCPTEDSCRIDYHDGAWYITPQVP